MESTNDELMNNTATDGKPPVVFSADLEEEYYDDEYYENQPHENCPKCGRYYDDIDFDYQSCSKCGWNEAEQKWGEAREP